MSAKLMTKMTTKSIRINDVPGGGIPEITQMDVAGSLGMGGLSLPAYWFGRIKYCDDKELINPLRGYFGSLIGLKSFNEKSKNRRKKVGALSLKIADIAINQTTTMAKCKKCKGRGEHPNYSGSLVTCDQCNGTGEGRMSTKAKCYFCGVSDKTYTKNYKQYEDYLIDICNNLDQDIKEHLVKQLREKEC